MPIPLTDLYSNSSNLESESESLVLSPSHESYGLSPSLSHQSQRLSPNPSHESQRSSPSHESRVTKVESALEMPLCLYFYIGQLTHLNVGKAGARMTQRFIFFLKSNLHSLNIGITIEQGPDGITQMSYSFWRDVLLMGHRECTIAILACRIYFASWLIILTKIIVFKWSKRSAGIGTKATTKTR